MRTDNGASHEKKRRGNAAPNRRSKIEKAKEDSYRTVITSLSFSKNEFSFGQIKPVCGTNSRKSKETAALWAN